MLPPAVWIWAFEWPFFDYNVLSGFDDTNAHPALTLAALDSRITPLLIA